MSKKANSLKLTEEKLRDLWKKEKKFKYEDIEAQLDPNLMKESYPHWSTGSISIDYLIGGKPNKYGVPPCPGIPKGKIVNLYGQEASGKSTLAQTIAADICKNGGTVLYIDCENEIDLRYAKSIGVPIDDNEKFRLYQPETMEQALAIALVAISAGVSLVVWDSVGAAIPESEHEKSEKAMDETAKIGLLAKKWSEKLPILKARAAKTKTILLGISQMRANISSYGPGEKYTVQGGSAWKYYSALRMKLARVAWDNSDILTGLDKKKDKGVVGMVVEAKLDKCKVSDQQNMKIQFYIRYGEGIDNLRTLIETAMSRKVIKKGGAGWMTWNHPNEGEIKFQGVEKFRTYFMENVSAQEILNEQIFKEIFSSDPVEEEEEEEFDEEEVSLEEDLENLLS